MFTLIFGYTVYLLWCTSHRVLIKMMIKSEISKQVRVLHFYMEN